MIRCAVQQTIFKSPTLLIWFPEERKSKSYLFGTSWCGGRRALSPRHRLASAIRPSKEAQRSISILLPALTRAHMSESTSTITHFGPKRERPLPWAQGGMEGWWRTGATIFLFIRTFHWYKMLCPGQPWVRCAWAERIWKRLKFKFIA